MSDLHQLLQRLDDIAEGTVTPVGVKHGLNPQQKKVNQMPALFKAKDISPVLGAKKDPEHPAKGYFVGGESVDDGEGWGNMIGDAGADSTPDGVSPDTKMFLEKDHDDEQAAQGHQVGEDQEDNPMIQAVHRRIVFNRPEWITKYGVDAIDQAVIDVVGEHWDGEEIGSSDVSAYVSMIGDLLRDQMGSREEMDDRRPFAESAETATEDVLSTVKKKLGDYLSDLSKEIKQDTDLKDKIPQAVDQIGPAVKTIQTDDGHEIKIHGNEDDGFRVSIKNRPSKSRFGTLDEAVMACEMFCSHRRTAESSCDYMEER